MPAKELSGLLVCAVGKKGTGERGGLEVAPKVWVDVSSRQVWRSRIDRVGGFGRQAWMLKAPMNEWWSSFYG